MPGWGPALGLSPAIQRRMQRVKLSREILPCPLVDVIDLWWLYALLGVIDLWWLYGWHVGVTALFGFYGSAGFVLYKKRSQVRQNQARHEYGSFEFRVSVLALSFGLLFSLRQW